jgi:hypothetical protein
MNLNKKIARTFMGFEAQVKLSNAKLQGIGCTNDSRRQWES